MTFVFEPPEQSTVAVLDGTRFPVHRIYCVGRNYAAHVREMGFDPDREEPFFFMKPADAVVPDGGTVPYPPMTSDFQHEVELVVAVGKGGRDIPEGSATSHIFGYGVGIDMTRRDLQIEARTKGRPWDFGKGFDASAPCGRLMPAAEVRDLKGAQISLTVNAEKRQASDLAHMIWTVPEIVAYLSRFVSLVPGDLIYTGTPEGVGPVLRGDRLEARIEGLEALTVRIG
jgi:fumarylpyruvate hydrolase